MHHSVFRHLQERGVIRFSRPVLSSKLLLKCPDVSGFKRLSARNCAGRPQGCSSPSNGKKEESFVGKTFKFVSRVVAATIFTVGMTPYLLSWQPSRNLALAAYNRTIPGTLCVEKVSLSWEKPILIERLTLDAPSGRNAIDIERLESELCLWKLVASRLYPFGQVSVQSLRVNLVPDEAGDSQIDLALKSSKSLGVPETNETIPRQRQPSVEREVEVDAEISTPVGRFCFPGAKAIVTDEIRNAVGEAVKVEVFIDLWKPHRVDIELGGKVVKASHLTADFGSSNVNSILVGFLFWEGLQPRIYVPNPIRIEADLTESLSHVIFSRVHPLLADVAPREDEAHTRKSHIIAELSPEDKVLPAKQYSVRIQPVTAALSRNSLAGKLVEFITARKEPVSEMPLIETSEISLRFQTDGLVECDQVDVLIGGHVHLAGWGSANPRKGFLQSYVSIPGDTLEKYLRLKNLPPKCAIVLPILGSMQRPRVDLGAAARQVADLTFSIQTKKMTQLLRDLSGLR